ncbi:MAG: enoyl-CoA hydratase/isomerase family protein [Pseudomonadota bacterium]
MSFRLSAEGDVAVLALDRPPVNALDPALVAALEPAVADLARSRPRGLVLTGEGRAFSAGVDTRAFAACDSAGRAAMILAITRVVGKLYALPFPVVAAVNGHAMGGGFVLMLTGDVRIATDDPAARFGLQEAQAGIPFPAGPLEVIRAELSPELLRRLTLTSVAVGSAALHALGVVDRLAPAGEGVAAAADQVRVLAAQPGFSLVKAQLRRPTVRRLEALAAAGEDPLIAALDPPDAP